MRLFVAVEVGDDVRRTASHAINELQRRAQRLTPHARVTWVEPEQLHLTVHFIGHVDPALSGTVGNNVRAEGDRAGVNFGPPAPPTGAGRWDHPWTDSYEQTGNPVPDLYAATTSVFHWVNALHDRFAARGFDAPWGNFQRDNLGLGGVGNDPVWAAAGTPTTVFPISLADLDRLARPTWAELSN